MKKSDWQKILVREVEAKGQAATARMLGYSASTVNQILQGKWQAGTENIERRVLEVFGHEKIVCTVLGGIEMGRCAEERAKPKRASSPVAVDLSLQCPICENNPKACR